MSPSYDSASSILLCAEDGDSILGFDDVEEQRGHRPRWGSDPKRFDFYGDLPVDSTLQSDERLGWLVAREQGHLPREDYGQRLRSGALDLSVHAHYNFGPLSAYLSVNYLDRFLSAYEFPQGKTWMTRLLVVTCLTLAAKMEETEVPLSLDLQVGETKYVFEDRTIQRMELLVLNTLEWRMQAVTPFSYIDFFLHKLSGGNSPTKLLVSRSTELILGTVKGTDCLAFRPSVIAAAIALLVLSDAQVVDAEKSLSFCTHVAKERVLECFEVIQDKVFMRRQSPKDGSSAVSSVLQSPVGVLDACLLDLPEENFGVLREFFHPKTKNKKTEEQIVRESEEEKDNEECTWRTKEASEKLVHVRSSVAQPKNVPLQSTESKLIEYKPPQQSTAFNSGAKERIIPMVEMPVDPLEPQKFKHRRVPKASGSPPVTVMHSPPRRVSVKDQQDWKIPHCISNWKHPKDKRPAADGRVLQDVQINDHFAKFAEAMSVAGQKAQDAIEMRAKVLKELMKKENERREQELRALGRKARCERTGIAPAPASPLPSDKSMIDDAEIG
ncbi:Cyclin, C-terminal domain [Musa troglodytarum]|uniref:Cyclin, C-terminal domain n=2 Tax=Musa troglodytarum TaxID=320322 RepID=A0A9E7FYG7_9LILI|nr:Cyclin, C-terminal domain [Musa troglodytarum]